MSKKRSIKKLRKYIRDTADLMDIHGWTLYIHDNDARDWENFAEIVVSKSDQIATIRFRKDWHEWDGPHLRHVVVHELVHTWTNSTFRVIHNADTILSEEAIKILERASHPHIEDMTDAITRALAQHLPLME